MLNDESLESHNHEDFLSINNKIKAEDKEIFQLLDYADTCSINDHQNNDLHMTVNSDADISINSQKFYYFYQGTVLFLNENLDLLNGINFNIAICL